MAGLIVAILASAAALRVQPRAIGRGAVRMETPDTASPDIPAPVSTSGRYVRPLPPGRSPSLPFLRQPPALDGSMLGDVGFVRARAHPSPIVRTVTCSA